MLLLLGFAFIAGVVTVLSPCILPILPIVLSSSVDSGKRKPLGVVTGFVFSFTFFTLFLTSIVKATGISADALRSISIVVIAAFGLSFLIPQFQLLLERLFTKLAGVRVKQYGSGFVGGFVIGLSIGLLWTPCVGPILASVISLALTGSVTGSAFFITLAYSLGTAIPMFAVVYGGRELLNRNQWLLKNTANIQKAFGVVMIITAVGIFFNIDRKFQAYVLEKFPQYGAGLTSFEDNDMVKKQLQKLKEKPREENKQNSPLNFLNQNYREAPEIIEGGQWFNSEPLKVKKLRGKVVLIDFWTYTCINCIRTLPYLRSWHDKYSDKGLVIIGVHTPEFEFEKNAENVRKAIADFKLKYPVIQDNDYATWQAYDNHYWPAKYLIDKDGRIRYEHFGEGEYDVTEEMIRKLLEETGTKIDEEVGNEIPDETPEGKQTPETYLGVLRMERRTDSPEGLPLHYFHMEGWDVFDEHSVSEKNATLTFHIYASKVFLVMNPTNSNGKVRVKLDGKVVNSKNAGTDVKDGIVTLDKDRLYHLINLPKKETIL